MLAGFVLDGLATARRERVMTGGKMIEVTRLRKIVWFNRLLIGIKIVCGVDTDRLRCVAYPQTRSSVPTSRECC
jgi:hypothetical protein